MVSIIINLWSKLDEGATFLIAYADDTTLAGLDKHAVVDVK